jgi:hypothetical protein
MVRLEANVTMNLNIYRSQGVQGEGFLIMFSDSSFFEEPSILILKLQKVLASSSGANLSLVFQFFVIFFKFKNLSTQFENKVQSHVHIPHSPRLAIF